MSQELGVGIVGCGGMGGMHSRACGAIEGVRIVALHDIVPGHAEKLAETTGADVMQSADELIARRDVNVVFVTTPTPSHHEIAIPAIKAGKHVFIEKPLARTLNQAELLLQTAKEATSVVVVGQVVRYMPAYEVLRDAVQDGRWGALLDLRMVRIGAIPDWGDGWFCDEKQSGGAILDLHLHDVDFMAYTLGLPRRLRTRGLHNETGWHHITTLYQYSGFQVEIQGSWHLAEKYPFNPSYLAVFEAGVLELDGTRSGQLLFYPRNGSAFTPEMNELPEGTVEGINVTELGPYLIEVQAFIDAIRRGVKDIRIDISRVYDSLRLVMLEIESVEKDCELEVK